MKIAGLTLNFRTVFWGLAGITLAVLLVLAFQPQPVLVDLAEVSRAPRTVSVRDEARTRVREGYIVSAPLGGRLLRINHHAGDSVVAGELLATILPGDPALLDARSQVEARAAVRSCNVPSERLHFMDMPFYETGTVRKKPIGEDDIQITIDLLEKVKPHQIYAAGDLSDPHGTHRVCL